MSIAGLSRNRTDPAIDYDHAIVLVDTTKVKLDREENTDGPSDSVPLSRTASGAPLSLRWTKGTLREELARRKYSKWQEEKTRNDEELAETSDGAGDRNVEAGQLTNSRGRNGRLRDKIPFRSKKPNIRSNGNDDTFVDILYENQRGAFFCGIPLYSGNSLLNFDPSPWQTSSFKDSPVNVTNAQLPDPSWAWAWRTWYVDMSYDVDEEGWQYSFTFSPRYAWHGSHPWFHSFVRRRRWLRKRIKSHGKTSRDTANIKEAHLLNADYFTIHASRDRSRDSSAERTSKNRSSFLSNARSESDGEQDSSDVSDIVKLMAILKGARVDREKIWAVKAFLDQGGDDLFYLADRMGNIMRYFVYQTSRRQLQGSLLQALEYVKHQQEISSGDADDADELWARKASNLVKAVRAAGEHLNDDPLGNSGADAKSDESQEADMTQHLDSEARSHDAFGKIAGEDPDVEDTGSAEDEIKGIPDNAEISDAPGIRWDSPPSTPPPKTIDKGKGKA
ncbi:hypothetical protein MMC07_009468 [Pseudocyphellaria aurata]|nr:hypothetical protein [Pseudocyphellaria aurata]